MRCTIGSTIEENTEITFFLLGSQYFDLYILGISIGFFPRDHLKIYQF